MKNMLIKIRDSLADNVVGAIATAAWSAVCIAALFLLRSAASLYATDPLATAAVCFSMLVLGATAGYLVCYAIDRQETRKRRRALANLPAFQAAICWEGYEAEGTFFTGFSRDDCKVLSDRGFISAVCNETWMLTDGVRELIQRSRRLQRILKAKHDKAFDMRSAEALEAEAEMALECIDGLSAEDAICLVRLATKGPMTTAHYNLEYMHPYFKQLVDISRVSPSEDRITLTDAAKEALKMRPELVNSIAPMSM